MKKVLMSRIQTLCVGCLAVPVASFMLGIASISYPVLVVLLSVLGGGVLWWVLLQSFMPKEVSALDAKSITGLLSVAAGGIYGYLAGIIVGSTGQYVKEAIVISFAMGLIAAILYRSHNKDLVKYGAVIEEKLSEPSGNQVVL